MNRLSQYFKAAHLAKIHILGAREYSRKEQRANFEHNVINALEALQAAQNNIASIAFNKRPKK
jgi:primosomal protein N'